MLMSGIAGLKKMFLLAAWIPSPKKRFVIRTKGGAPICKTLIPFLVNLSRKLYNHSMKSLPVGEIKAQFSEILEKVQQGESFEITYAKSKKPVARIIPINGTKTKKKRKLGILEGKVKFKFAKNFKMTDEELLDLRG